MKSISLATLGVLGVLLVSPVAPQAAECESSDLSTYVAGSGHCFALKTYKPENSSPSTLVVVFHGDLSSGGPADYIFPVAQKAADLGAVGVVMMRPGYSGDGRKSSGVASRNRRRDDIYIETDIDSIASAVAALKQHHDAQRVVLVGHSGGAVMAGVILGRAAPLVDSAILISCPCDVPKWRELRGRKPLVNAESPVDYLQSAPKTATIYALTGENDRNTYPVLGERYVASARKAGLTATFVKIPNAGHGFGRLWRQPYILDSLKSALAGR